MENVSGSYPCPCCGHLTFDEAPGSYLICRVCFWEDDLVQLRWPTYPGGANKPSLVDAQRSFARDGASEKRLVPYVRRPSPDEPLDDGGRPIDLEVDDFEDPTGEHQDWPADSSVLYWWRPTFWRRAT
jgi:hypothetical protein